MNNQERRDLELPYIADAEVFEEMKVARRHMQIYNTTDRSDFETLTKLVRGFLGKSGNNVFINPPFYFDYGKHIEVGDNFFANYNCTILDVAKVKIVNKKYIVPTITQKTSNQFTLQGIHFIQRQEIQAMSTVSQ